MNKKNIFASLSKKVFVIFSLLGLTFLAYEVATNPESIAAVLDAITVPSTPTGAAISGISQDSRVAEIPAAETPLPTKSAPAESSKSSFYPPVPFAPLDAPAASDSTVKPGTYTDTINTALTASPYIWNLKNVCNQGICYITKVDISGTAEINSSGYIFVYIENGGNTFLLFSKQYILNTTTILQNVTTEEWTETIDSKTGISDGMKNITLEINTTVEIPINVSISGSGTLDYGYTNSSYNLYFKAENKTIILNSITYIWEKISPEQERKITKINFIIDAVLEIKSASTDAVFVKSKRKGITNELWMYNLDKQITEIISEKRVPSADFPISLKGGFVFWVSEDQKTLYTMNISNRYYIEKQIPLWDRSKGERAEITFDETPWKVILFGVNDINFFSPQTGEVFSDDNGDFNKAFGDANLLKEFLTEEQLNKLHLEGN